MPKIIADGYNFSCFAKDCWSRLVGSEEKRTTPLLESCAATLGASKSRGRLRSFGLMHL